jgi:hypothetical protein
MMVLVAPRDNLVTEANLARLDPKAKQEILVDLVFLECVV